jgi:hypothetical protein
MGAFHLQDGSTGITRAVRGQKGINLLSERALLDGGEEVLGFGKCQTQMLDTLVAFVQGDHLRHGFLAAIVATPDELKFDTHGEAPPVR